MKKWSFSFCLTLSIFCHLTLVLFFAFYSRSFFKPKTADLIESSIQVDQVGLPDLKPELSKSPAEDKKSPVALKTRPDKKFKPKKIAKPEKKPTKKNKKSSPGRKEKPKSTKSNNKESAPSSQKTKPNQANPNTSDAPKKGNQTSRGDTQGKLLSSKDRESLTLYASQIVAQTKAYWNLPNYLMNEKRVTQVEIKISGLGQISYKQIVSPSGSDLYDSLVLKAIEQAEPYPEPPKSIQKFIKNGIVLSFPNQ